MQRLQDAAEAAFTKRGYHATRIDDIVAEADTSHGTFYLYFANKDDVLRALVADIEGNLLHLCDQLPDIGGGDDSSQQLRAWIAEYCALYRKHGPIIRAFTDCEADPSGPPTTRLSTLVQEAFERRLPAEHTGVRPDVAALVVVALLERFAHLISTQEDVDEQELAVDVASAFAHQGLFGA